METRKRMLLLGLFLCLGLSMKAQMESSLAYRRYTLQDGLPQMQAERLWQDSYGYIYIGTLSGFVRFDGRDFTPFLKGRRENIVGFVEIDGQTRALSFCRQWLVDGDEVEVRPIDSKRQWMLNNLNAGSLPNGYVLLEDEREVNRRLCRVTEQGFDVLLEDSLLDRMGSDRKLFLEGRDEWTAYIPTANGLYRLSEGKTAEKLTDKSDIFTLLRTDSQLLAFASDGISVVGTDSLQPLAATDWTAATFGLTVRALHSGNLIIADEHTVYLYNGQDIKPLVSGINLIRDVLIDCWDRLWVATYQGTYCFFNRGFINHWLTDKNDIVRAIAVGENGLLMMGTLNGKVLMRDPVAGMVVVEDNDQQYYAPSAVTIDGNVYMPGNGDVVCISTKDAEPAMHWLGLPPDRYQFVAKTDGRLVAGSRSCIVTYNLTTEAVDTLTTDILHPWCAAEDAQGRLWVGSSPGLYCIDSQGTVKNDYPQKLIITTMDADKEGNIFFASADSLFVIQNGEVRELNSQMPDLASHEIRALHLSPHGYLVVAVIDGLFVGRISKECQISDVHFFNQRNGFTMLEPLKSTMAETADGMIWLAGLEQMTSFRPADLLSYDESETYITPPLRWWQHVWVWLCALLLLALAIWAVTHWYEKLLNQKKMIRLQREKLQKEQQLRAIRQKAIEAESTNLARDIVKITEKTTDERFTFRTASGTLVVEAADIAFFKGYGNYSQIVTFHTKDTVLVGLGALEKMLDAETFVRADRSTLVNIHNVCQLLPKQHRCLFRSSNGQEVETTLLAPAFKRLKPLL